MFILAFAFLVFVATVSAKSSQKRSTSLTFTTCDACVDVVGFIEAWANTTSNEQLIASWLADLCELLPAVYQPTCDALSTPAEIAAIINYLEAGYPPAAICQMIGICANSTSVIKQKSVKNVGDECSDCTVLVGFIESWANTTSNEQLIAGWLQSVCAYLPSTYQPTCDALATPAEVAAIINYLEAGYPPATIFAMMGFCTSKDPKTSCEVCSFVEFAAKSWMTEFSSAEIAVKIAALCDKLPSSFTASCKVLATPAQMQKIVDHLKAGNSVTVCPIAGMC